jgi:hypothetical protein
MSQFLNDVRSEQTLARLRIGTNAILQANSKRDVIQGNPLKNNSAPHNEAAGGFPQEQTPYKEAHREKCR